MSVLDLQPVIEEAFENRASINSKTVTPQLRKAIDEVIAALDAGVIRVAEKKDGDWVTNQWIKKAVLLSFRIEDNFLTEVPGGAFYDKVHLSLKDTQLSVLPRKAFVQFQVVWFVVVLILSQIPFYYHHSLTSALTSVLVPWLIHGLL